MKKYGCQSKNLKNLLPNQYWIALLFSRNVPYTEVYRIPLKKKNNPSKNMAFMGDSFSFYYGIEYNEFTKFLVGPAWLSGSV